MAEAAAVLLANEGQYDGPTPPLTAAQALDLAALAALASEQTGRPIHRQIVPDDGFQAQMAARGLPGHIIDIIK